MSEIYPRPQWQVGPGDPCPFGAPLSVVAANPEDRDLAAEVAAELARGGVPGVRSDHSAPAAVTIGRLDDPAVAELLAQRGVLPLASARHPGGYVLSASPDGAVVAGFDADGAYWGVQSLRQVMRCERGRLFIDALEVHDWPHKSVRGVHLYMPGPGQIEFFKRFVTWLARLKYNTLYLEVGGGMEYERHPAINQAWARFCREAAAFPGGQRGLQDSQPWVKDSTHAELAQGAWLSKRDVAYLVAWARGHHLEVIPEVPCLSHAYYLCLAYPEIAERRDDPHPDTYCPSNPRTYEILFDVLEEVIEVFEPRTVHIGHDEIINLGHCHRCRGKTGADLLAGDVNRIHAFLAQRGIRTAMWGDKLLPLATGGRFGGGLAMDGGNSYWGRANSIPATYQAISQVPHDLLISNWYWGIDRDASRAFFREGFEVVLGNFGGNFQAQKFDRWHEDGAAAGILGAEVSTWCEVSDFAFGYNGCFFNLLFAAQMLWWSHYRDLDREAVAAAVARQTRHLRRWLAGEDRRPELAAATPVPLAAASAAAPPAPFVDWLQLPGEAGVDAAAGSRYLGVDVAALSCAVPVGVRCAGLRFLHGCATEKKRRATWLLPDPGALPPEDLLALYRVRYTDGLSAEIPVYYGTHVGRWDIPYGDHVDAIPYRADPVPAGRDPAGRRITLYALDWVNPRPEAEVASLAVEYRGEAPGALWLFGLARLEAGA
ncbi:MAG: family 20 glycosylhydrolase [Gemmatimonadota bacterium]